MPYSKDNKVRLVADERHTQVYLAVVHLCRIHRQPVTPDAVAAFLVKMQEQADKSRGSDEASRPYARPSAFTGHMKWTPRRVASVASSCVDKNFLTLDRNAAGTPYLFPTTFAEHKAWRLHHGALYATDADQT